MSRGLSGSNDIEKLEDLSSRTYKEQAIWFLNAFWTTFGEAEAEKIWAYTHKYGELDLEKKAEGCELDELNAHRLLEAFNETMTVRELREGLRGKGAISASAKKIGFMVPISHFLIMRYDADFHVFVNAPQGNQDDVEEAQRRLEVAQAALLEAQQREAEAKSREAEAKKQEAVAVASENEAKAREADAVAAENEAKAREADAISKHEAAEAAAAEARAREAEAREAEAPFKAAQEELEAAVAELKAQEDAYNQKTEELKAKGEGTGVAAMRAKNELAQHLGEDPLPLRRAKITQEAALKKAERLRGPFEAATKAAEAARAAADTAEAQAAAARDEATRSREAAEAARRAATSAREVAEAARQQATEARAAAEAASRAAEAALQEAHQRFKEAEDYLEEVKNTIGYGQSWWLDRELHESKKYMPLSKGGISRS